MLAQCRTAAYAQTLHTSPEVTDALPKLVLLGTPKLMQRSPAVNPDDITSLSFQRELETLKQCMIRYGGIGIAGPQIGWYQRVFCFGLFKAAERYPALNPDTLPFQYWINPVVNPANDSRPSWFWEGCLSVPDISGWVERPDKVIVEGYDGEGQWCQLELDGIAARVLQHEYDHLDGVLFPSRVSKPTHLVPNELFKFKETWARDWPTPAARECPKGQLWYAE
ncbi:hypothetical protein CYMTET_43062 [Cymbomonas tetramitiformis]|uniref:Peptide deformylase n=1 Tax=Cymbomonas tetramitiformis TaxID=36881 RepID=A0AAE0C2X4_9CHLO|nr:hypothetical protein CYMTET_43062 [Cymbomonas tetramitiformis]